MEWGLQMLRDESYTMLVKQANVYIVHGIFEHRGHSADIQVTQENIASSRSAYSGRCLLQVWFGTS